MFGKLKRALILRMVRGAITTGVATLAAEGYVSGSSVQTVTASAVLLVGVVYQMVTSDTPIRVQIAQYGTLIFTGGLLGAGVVTPEQAQSAAGSLLGDDVIGGETLVRVLDALVVIGTSVDVTRRNARGGGA